MSFTYTNRRGQTYYLHAGKAKAGKPRYYMSMKIAGNPVEAIPEGYQVWESPADAQVFVRKVPPKIIADAEVELVRKLTRTKAKTQYTIVDVKDKAIIVYSADDDVEERIRLFSALGDPDTEATRRFMEGHLRYHAMLQFELVDEAARTFCASRWCFLGAIDNWFMLDSGPLEKLAKQYIPHVGAQSFFELM